MKPKIDKMPEVYRREITEMGETRLINGPDYERVLDEFIESSIAPRVPIGIRVTGSVITPQPGVVQFVIAANVVEPIQWWKRAAKAIALWFMRRAA